MSKKEKIQLILQWAKNPSDTHSDSELEELGFTDFEDVLIEVTIKGCEELLKSLC